MYKALVYTLVNGNIQGLFCSFLAAILNAVLLPSAVTYVRQITVT